jgi:dienelactone hydrolase
MFSKTLAALAIALPAIAISSSNAHATLVKKMVDYKDGSTKLQGYLVYDDAATSKGAKPGVLVIHNWMGLTDEAKSKADAIAELGYVAFAADIYGAGVHPKDANEAGQLAGSYKNDRAKLRKRAMAGLKTLEKQKGVDGKRLAAIGYCFGGTTAIELGRAGAGVKSLVSFHGGLDSPKPVDGKNIKAHVLILHGADDPFNKPEDVKAFQDEMRTNKIDWQMIEYGGAVHSFTEKSAGSDNSKGAAYNEAADRRSWQAMQDFFRETL